LRFDCRMDLDARAKALKGEVNLRDDVSRLFAYPSSPYIGAFLSIIFGPTPHLPQKDKHNQILRTAISVTYKTTYKRRASPNCPQRNTRVYISLCRRTFSSSPRAVSLVVAVTPVGRSREKFEDVENDATIERVPPLREQLVLV
jgi:hypothetical protein